MRKLLLVVLGSFLMVSYAETPSAFGAAGKGEQFSLANQRYTEGDYEEAVSFYEALVRSDVSSGPLYYNLGNAYFKLGRLGKSILNYERARRWMSQDEDLLANLSFAESLREQAQPRERYLWVERIFVALRDLFSASSWAVCLLIVYHLLFGTLVVMIFADRMQRKLFPFVWTLAFLTLFCLVFTSTKIADTKKTQQGVIVQRVVDVRYSPSQTGAVAFQLREGIKAQVNRCEGGWCHIRLTRDKSGWVEAAAIEAI